MNRWQEIFSLGLIVLYRYIGCPIRWLFGTPCPSCGMTRAFLSLLSFDIKGAFYYHPLVFLVPIFFMVLLKSGKRSNRILYFSAAIMLAVFLATYIIRFKTGHPVVSVHYSDSVICWISKNIFKGA